MHATRFGAALLAGVLLTGCAAHAAPATPTVRLDPKAPLAHALDGMATGKFSFDVAFPEEHWTGSVDQADHQASWTAVADGQPGRIITVSRVIGEDLYVTSYGGGGNPPVDEDTWRHFDLSREKPDEDPLQRRYGDVENLQPILESLIVTSANGRTVQATIDLAASRRNPALTTPEMSTLIVRAGDRPTPATVQLDDQGRLISVTATLATTPAASRVAR